MSCIEVPKIKSYVPEINTSGVLCLNQPTGQDIHAKETASSGIPEGQKEMLATETSVDTSLYSGTQVTFPKMRFFNSNHSMKWDEKKKKKTLDFKRKLLVAQWFVYLTPGPCYQNLQLKTIVYFLTEAPNSDCREKQVPFKETKQNKKTPQSPVQPQHLGGRGRRIVANLRPSSSIKF